MDPLTPPPKIKCLESVRGLAATFVVIHHMPAWNPALYDIAIIRNGGLLVDLFFVLSGYVIYNAYGDRIRSFGELSRFQFLRLGRLYPVHLLFLLVFIGIEASKLLAKSRYGMAMPNTAPFRESGGVALGEQLLLLQAILPTGHWLSFNSAAWSISVEFYTYLIFGFIVLFARRVKHAVFGVVAAVSIVLLFDKLTFGESALIRCLAGFFTGCLTAALAGTWRVRLPRNLVVLAFAALILFMQFETDPHLDAMTYFLSAFLILTLVSAEAGWMHSLLDRRFMTWLGTISYSIYMSHTAVIWVVNQVFRVVLKAPATLQGDRITPQLPVGEALVGYVAVIASVLVVSQLTYRYLEAPLRQRSRDWVFTKFRGGAL